MQHILPNWVIGGLLPTASRQSRADLNLTQIHLFPSVSLFVFGFGGTGV
jgi:hypothetical protein